MDSLSKVFSESIVKPKDSPSVIQCKVNRRPVSRKFCSRTKIECFVKIHACVFEHHLSFLPYKRKCTEISNVTLP